MFFDRVSDTSAASIPLLKLHGSANWAICGECRRIRILGQKLTADPDYFRNRPCDGCGKSGLRLLLVPPSWDKSEYSEVMRPVWEKAVSALKAATRICIIGYSMPQSDAFFRFLLTLGLAENDRLSKLVVVDLLLPDGGLAGTETRPARGRPQLRIDERYKEMLEDVFVERRFRFHPSGVAEFVRRGFCQELGRGEQIGS